MELSYAKIYFSGFDVFAGGVLARTDHGLTNQLLYACASFDALYDTADAA
jgi:hypothetical protein